MEIVFFIFKILWFYMVTDPFDDGWLFFISKRVMFGDMINVLLSVTYT